LYRTSISCANATRFAAELRVYAHPSEVYPAPDNTILYVVAKAVFPVGQVILLEALRTAPFPGNPTDNESEEHVPYMVVPTIIAVGQICSGPQTIPDKHSSRSFSINTGEYVRDRMQTCVIEGVFDGSNKRWESLTGVPAMHTFVQVVGVCREISTTGTLLVNVESITLNIDHNTNMSNVAFASPETTNSPNKKRKFSAFAS
ncbi:hypothetical protein R3P38DRAFT_2473609, partial [Favolaschia claudopus]